MAKSLSIAGDIYSSASLPNLDGKYGPYESVEEAFELLGPDEDDVLAVGLTVGIQPDPDGPITEYWFKDACESVDDLVPKGNVPAGVVIDANYVHTDNNFTTAEKTKLAELENYDDTIITAELDNKVDKVSGKGLSTNDYSTIEKNKLATIEENAQENTIDTVKVNGTALIPDQDKAVDIEIPEYSIAEVSTTTGYAKSYQLKKDNTFIGTKINIPKDLVVESGSVETVDTPDVPYEGAEVGDKYIDLVLNDENEDHIYIPVKDLVDVYTAGDGIDVTNNEISININSSNANGLSVSASGLSLAVATTSTAGALSSTDKTKLDSIENNAQENIIEEIKVNGTALTPDIDKAVDVTVPTNTSDLTNDSGFIDNTVDDLVNYTNTSDLTDLLDNKVDKVTGKQLSTEDYTTAEQTKLTGIEDGAQENIIESIEINGVTATIDANKKASLNIEAGAIDTISIDGTPLTIDQNKNVDIPLATTTDDGAMSASDKNKLDSIDADAEANIIESISVNNTAVSPDVNKNVNITVPTKTSDLTNDSDFVDADVDYLTYYYTKTELDGKIASVFHYKGSVRTYAQLPVSDLTVGDVYNVATKDDEHHIKAGDNVAWAGTEWDVLAGDIDLSSYYTKTQVNTMLSNKINEPLVDGTAGQVLTTNGAGGRSWTTVQGSSEAGHWSSIVTCNVGATSCTINDVNIKSTSTIEEFTENTSNTQIAILSRTISAGKIVLTFDALTEVTKFKLHIWDETTPPTPSTHTVTFNSHGGSTVPSQTVNTGDVATQPEDPTKEDCTFDGWYTEDTYENLYNFNSPVVGDIELHAKWETI